MKHDDMLTDVVTEINWKSVLHQLAYRHSVTAIFPLDTDFINTRQIPIFFQYL